MTRSSKGNNRAQRHSQVHTLDIASLVEKDAHTASVYHAYTEETAEDERREIHRKVNARLEEIYRNEYRAKDAVRERFRRAVRLHVSSPDSKLEDSQGAESIKERSRTWLQMHGKLLAQEHTYQGLDELEKWITQKGLSDHDRLNLLESCW